MTDKSINDLELRKLRLQTALAEYQAMRAEILQKFRNHLQIYAVSIAAITAMLGWVVTKNVFDVLLVIPIVSIALTLRYIWEQNVIVTLGDYLRKMESEVFPSLLSSDEIEIVSPQPFIMWEHYFQDNFPNLSLYKPAILVLLVLIPIVPGVIFSLSCLLNSMFSNLIPITSQLHIGIHWVALLIYSPLGGYLSWKLWNS
ncbi:MAG: hypothetical protein V3T17_17405 [Pseudomonadales bacterium]